MSGQFGYEEIRKLAFFALAIGEAFEESSTKSGIARLASFLSCADEALTVLSIDRGKLLEEWKDFNSEEQANLFAECAEKFDLADEALEQRIEASIAAGFKILEGIEAAVGAWKVRAAQ